MYILFWGHDTLTLLCVWESYIPHTRITVWWNVAVLVSARVLAM